MNKTIIIRVMLLVLLTMLFTSCAEVEVPKSEVKTSEKAQKKSAQKSKEKISEILPANYLFEGDYIKIHSPNSEGWSVLDKTANRIVMGKKSSEGNYIAKVVFFPIYTVEKEVFFDLIKNEMSKIKSDKRYSVVSLDFKPTEKRSYPCVETKQLLKDKISTTTDFLMMQINALYCKDPRREGAGFMIGYSFRGQKIIEDIDKQADSFIEGVQFP